jgi:TolB protein
MGVVLVACLVVAGVGVAALRAIDRPAPASQVAVPQATPPSSQRAPAAASPATPAPEAAAAATGGRITFVDPDGRLGTLAPDGSDKRMLSDAGWRYQFPAWAPDGRHVAAVGSDGQRGVVRVFLDEPRAQQVEVYGSRSQAPFYLYWSPDGRQVSFLANARRGIGLWLAPADGRQDARLLANGQPFYWDWTDDSTQMLVHTGLVGEDAALGFIDLDGDALGDRIAQPGLFQAPGLSADERFLAYGDARNRAFSVIVENRQNGRRSSTPHTGLLALSWSPTGSVLAFTSPRTPQASFVGPLRVLNADTGEVRTLVDDAVTGFFWSPTGQSIAYLTVEPDSSSPGAGRPAGLAAIASQPGAQGSHPEIRVRLSVVDVADGQRRLLTSFQPSDLFVTQFLPFFDQYALSHRLWSPDGDALVVPMVETSGREAIYIVPTDGRAPQRIVDGSMASWSH